MNFNEELILENERALLRPLTLEDHEWLSVFSVNEPDLWSYSLISAAGEEALRHYIQGALKLRSEEDSYAFIVLDKRINKYVGSTRFYDYQERHNTIQLGYTWYGKEFQGTGINKNCKYLMLEYAFEHLALDRVEFRADNNNKRSIAAMKSIGCQEEGILRSNCASPTGRRDSIVLSILRTEWQAAVKSRLLEKIKMNR